MKKIKSIIQDKQKTSNGTLLSNLKAKFLQGIDSSLKKKGKEKEVFLKRMAWKLAFRVRKILLLPRKNLVREKEYNYSRTNKSEVDFDWATKSDIIN